MKKVVLFAFLAIGLLTLMSFVESTNEKLEFSKNSDSDYDKGWEDGFCEGWRDVKGPNRICPITPIVPIPKISCNEGYKCGYNRGFKYGMCKAREGNCEK